MIDKRNLAYAYLILAKLDLDDHTYAHLSTRPKGADYFYIHPFGLRFEEVTEDKLLKVSLDGTVLEGSEYQYNQTGYIIHGSIYKARQDLEAVFHLHTVPIVAVSAMKEGLMPISQWALHFYGRLAYYEYNSLVLTPEQHGSGLVQDLGKKNIVFLRNHGVIACGKTIHEAMFYCYHLELACKAQLAALSTGAELVIPKQEVCKQTNKDIFEFEKDIGKRDWEAWVRFVDRG